jgi:hypothetical protein
MPLSALCRNDFEILRGLLALACVTLCLGFACGPIAAQDRAGDGVNDPADPNDGSVENQITGTVFSDLNGDGAVDRGELPLCAVVVEIGSATRSSRSATSSAAGGRQALPSSRAASTPTARTAGRASRVRDTARAND